MSDIREKFEELGQEIGGIVDHLEQRRRQDIPREPHDTSTLGLAEKIIEILSYLRTQKDIPLPQTGAERKMGEVGTTIEQALDKADQLAAQDGGGGGGKPGSDPRGGMGRENKRQDPVMKFGQAVECYDDQGAVWEKPRDGLYGSSFAKYAKLHPCSRAWDYHLGVVLYVDATKDVYIEFPNINPGGDARLKERPWPASVTGHDEEQATGVGYCPAGTIVAYHEYPDAQDDPTSGPITFKVTGIEAGWIRQLPWVLERGRSRAGVLPTAGFEAGYGEDVPIVMRLASAEGGVTIYGREHAIFDACGRMIAMGVEDALGSISAHVHIDEETIRDVHFA